MFYGVIYDISCFSCRCMHVSCAACCACKSCSQCHFLLVQLVTTTHHSHTLAQASRISITVQKCMMHSTTHRTLAHQEHELTQKREGYHTTSHWTHHYHTQLHHHKKPETEMQHLQHFHHCQTSATHMPTIPTPQDTHTNILQRRQHPTNTHNTARGLTPRANNTTHPLKTQHWADQ